MPAKAFKDLKYVRGQDPPEETDTGKSKNNEPSPRNKKDSEPSKSNSNQESNKKALYQEKEPLVIYWPLINDNLFLFSKFKNVNLRI